MYSLCLGVDFTVIKHYEYVLLEINCRSYFGRVRCIIDFLTVSFHIFLGVCKRGVVGTDLSVSIGEICESTATGVGQRKGLEEAFLHEQTPNAGQ